MTYEVNQPILNSPFDEPSQYWFIRENYHPELRDGRRPAIVYPPREGNTEWDLGQVLKVSPPDEFSPGFEMTLVNRIRKDVKEWRSQNYPGASRTTLELLEYWNREGRQHRLFFAQREAVETIIFLIESRADFRQGLKIPLDIPVDTTLKAFIRYACKMATGSGKTTVMGMLTAWSILNKVADRSNTNFSDVVLIVCPNVTIKGRLQELNPDNGEASLYRTRDLVPSHLMDKLRQGKVLVTNWHIFEKRSPSTGGDDGAKVIKVGVKTITTETIKIAAKNETARGTRYLTLESLQQQINLKYIKVIEEKKDKQGNLKEVKVETTRYLESDAAWINRILTQEIGNKNNILVFNDEAHHAYRIQPTPINEEDEEDEAEEYLQKESTIWVEGLDRIHQYRGINFCVDLSATPYYLKSAGQNTSKPFEWVVSDFSLMDAIESGLVKIPQLPVRDTTGADISNLAYFNIWQWMLNKMTPAERGKGKNPKPEAVLKYTQTPITLLGGQWEQTRQEWAESDDPRPPVLIVVSKNTKIAKCLYEWIAEDIKPAYLPSCNLLALRNTETELNTIRVDSKVVEEIESGNSKSDESKWMRFTLDTIGKTRWPKDNQGRDIYPEGFEQLAEKLNRPLHPPGRDIKCVISVGMLTEGWDCSTVKHIIGIRPFQSQLLCEQVVGRGLRRRSYELTENGLFEEETSTIFGVPFEVIPFKSNPGGAKRKLERRYHVYSVPQKSQYRIEFPRVNGYTQGVQNRVTVNWEAIAPLTIDPFKIAPEVQVKATLTNNQGRPSISGPGKLESIDLNPYRKGRRLQELVFELAKDLTRNYCRSEKCEAPPHVLFPQLRKICDRYLTEKVNVVEPAHIFDVFLSPYYGWVIEKLSEAIHPDTEAGEAPEVPIYEAHRGNGSTDEVNFFTGKPVRDVVKSHLNCVVADTHQWEQAAAYIIDTHPAVEAFVKNDHLDFAIPYFHNGEDHDYIPDFIIRFNQGNYLILETKGWDELREVKQAAALRWCAAINADGKHGYWQYVMTGLSKVKEGIEQALLNLKERGQNCYASIRDGLMAIKMVNILCVGVSTYREGTPEKVDKAFHALNFLDDWAVIWCGHKYFDIADSKDYVPKDRIEKVHFPNSQIVFVDSQQDYIVEKGKIYILPDTLFNFPPKICVEIINKNNQILIRGNNSDKIYEKWINHWQRNCSESSSLISKSGDRIEIYFPCIDMVMKDIAKINNIKKAGLILAGMGDDGAEGLLSLAQSQGNVAIQDPSESQASRTTNDTTLMPKNAQKLLDKYQKTYQLISLLNPSNKNYLSLEDWLSQL